MLLGIPGALLPLLRSHDGRIESPNQNGIPHRTGGSGSCIIRSMRSSYHGGSRPRSCLGPAACSISRPFVQHCPVQLSGLLVRQRASRVRSLVARQAVQGPSDGEHPSPDLKRWSPSLVGGGQASLLSHKAGGGRPPGLPYLRTLSRKINTSSLPQ